MIYSDHKVWFVQTNTENQRKTNAKVKKRFFSNWQWIFGYFEEIFTPFYLYRYKAKSPPPQCIWNQDGRQHNGELSIATILLKSRDCEQCTFLLTRHGEFVQ